jgi:hypothetical protein
LAPLGHVASFGCTPENLSKSGIPSGDELGSMIKGSISDAATREPASKTLALVHQQDSTASPLKFPCSNEARDTCANDQDINHGAIRGHEMF